MTIEIGRFQVDWTLASDDDRALAVATFDRLIDDILEPVLDGALHDVISADELVAIRSVQVAPIEVHRAEDADAWAGAVSAAIAGAVAAGGADVVRYRSPGSAVLDILRRVALGDTRREWAWRMLGLWPAASSTDPADVLCALLEAWPAAVVPALEAAGSALADALDLLGPDRLARLSAVVWAAVGADPVAFPVPAGAAGGALTSSVRATRTSAIGRIVAAAAAADATTTEVAAARNAAPVTSPAPAVVPGRADVRTVALAALLVAHADPASVRAGEGTAQVAALLLAAAQDRAGEPRGIDRDTTEQAGSLTGAGEPAGAAPTGRASRPAATEWAGLLFCLHVLRPLLEPGAPAGPGTVAADSALLATVGTVPALHALGLELCARTITSSWERTPGPADPAVLTFCGLDPNVAPPPAATDRANDVAALTDEVVVALRSRLDGRPPAALDDAALLRTVLRRHGTVVSDPGWRRVDLLLDEVSVDLRAAMLDLDPGWLPALGCVVRFGYG